MHAEAVLAPPSVREPVRRLGRGRSLVAFGAVSEILSAFGCAKPRDAAAAHSTFLSPLERIHANSISHPARMRDWLAARLLAKRLLLFRIFSGVLAQGGPPWPPVVVNERILPVWATRLREVALVNAPSRRGGSPNVCVRGRDLSRFCSASVAHAGGLVAVALRRGGPIGVDVERIANRSSSFRKMFFTSCEAHWAERVAPHEGLPADAAYTLLWTVKEAAFKAGECDQHLGRVHVLVRNPLDRRPEVRWRDDRVEHLATLNVEIQLRSRKRRLRTAITILGDCVLTAVSAGEGD
jgi:4'-phosphopantetheinyl transferase EntD